MQFSQLNLDDRLLRAVSAEGYTTPTPIQAQAIPEVLKGRDLLGTAQTGTGKTAAFALPMLQRLSASAPTPPPKHRPIRALILTPTRELAAQIGDSFATYGRHMGLHHAVIFGGVGQRAQEEALQRGVDILVATPGRLLDLSGQGFVDYDKLEIFVLDEADRMLDMGFIHDVRRVIALIPKKRQTLFFSATMPPEIQKLSHDILHQPARVAVAPVSATADRITQHLYLVDDADKRSLLTHLLRGDAGIERVLVFTRTKHGANRLTEQLVHDGITAEPIHGNKSQNARERALANFKSKKTRVLVATDIAARGIDIDDLTHVLNYDLPEVPETYVHRIGRTARAGASGVAWAFCSRDDQPLLRDIERLIRKKIEVSPTPALTRLVDPPRAPRQPHGRSRPRGQSSAPSRGSQNSPSRGSATHSASSRHAPAPSRSPSPHNATSHNASPRNATPRNDAGHSAPSRGHRPHGHGQGRPQGPRRGPR